MTALIFILGLIWGSFSNVVIFRLKKGEQFLWGNSYCPKCKKPLKWYHNIPLFSFLFLKGKCAYCRKKISIQYPLVEFISAIGFVLVGARLGLLGGQSFFQGESWLQLFNFIYFVAVFITLLLVAVYDFKWMEIPDALVKFGFAISMIDLVSRAVFSLAFEGGGMAVIGRELAAKLLGAIVVGGFFFLQHYLSKGKWIGGGDVALGLWLGFVVGISLSYYLILFAYIAGSLIAIGMMLTGKKQLGSRMPFGPFLAFSCFLVLLLQRELASYLGIF